MFTSKASMPRRWGNMKIPKFEDFYFKVCNLDYEKLSKEAEKLVDLMKRFMYNYID